MDTRGRKRAARNLRFYAAGAREAVYLLDAGDFVKVGRGNSVSSRLMTLNWELSRAGYTVGRLFVFPTAGRNLMSAEIACIHALRKVAAALPGRVEYFTGITLDTAAQIVQQTIGVAGIALPEPTPEKQGA
ncbi:MAG: hypothetical protein WC023_06415 [Rhodocyclaceae bacterium]